MIRINWLFALAACFIITSACSAQQLKLGDNPATLQKSALLDLASVNQGLLLPRISDTTLINTLNPPNGMIIYYTPVNDIMIRTNGAWQELISYSGLRLSNLSDATITSPVSGDILKYNGTKWVNFAPSYLTSVDTSSISNFYLKVRSLHSAGNGISYNSTTGVISNSGVLSVNGNTGALTMDTGYISNFYLKSRSLYSATSPITYNSSTGAIAINQATTSTSGYLSSTDWNTFNNKLSSVDTTSISSFSVKVRSLLSAGTGISYNSSTGVISNSGVLSVNGNTGALTMDTGYISSFYLKARSLHSATSPITYNSTTGAIGINQATTSVSGYLTSTDWNTFNNKLSSVDTSSISSFSVKVRSLLSAGTGISYNSATGAISNSGVLSVNGNTGALTMDTGYISSFYLKSRSLYSGTSPITYNSTTGAIAINQATTSVAGYLSTTDWNTFNNKLSSVDTSSISSFSVKVRSLLSAGSGISYNSATGAISNSGVLSVNGNTGALTMDTGYISSFYLKSRSLHSATSPLTYNSSTGAFAINQATTSVAGYLSSTDWNTFNNKLSSVDTSSISNFSVKVRSLHSAGSGISYNSATGAISNSGVLSVNGNTGALTMDTSYISSFYLKSRSLYSGTSPITYNSSTGAIGINLATTSVSGYLSSTDWNTFNGKQASGNYVTALTGDVTASGPGSVAATIGASKVTYSKIQNVTATDKVLGRITAGAGVVEEISTTGSGNVVRATSPALVTPTGIVKGDVGLGNVDNTSDASKPVSTATQTALDLKINLTEKAAVNGVATLDANGKIPVSQLTVGSQTYKGTWNATTNTPTLSDGTGASGDTYRVTTGGTINLGSGSITFNAGDDAIYNGSIWQLSASATVSITKGGTGQITANAGFNALVPSQTSNSGKILTTDGTNTSWTTTTLTVLLGSDITNNNASANTIADVTGLSFSVVSGNTYKFKFFIAYTAAATTTGSRWAINGPTNTFLYYTSNYSLTTTTTTNNQGQSTYDVPAASNATSAATGSNIAIVEGIIKPSANGTVIARFASEVANSAIVAKTGSYVEYKQLN